MATLRPATLYERAPYTPGAVPRPPSATAPADLQEQMIAILLRLGVIDAETARRGLPSPEEE